MVSSCSPLSPPTPLAMARSMLSLGMFAPRALSIARRSEKLVLASPPPSRAATVMARASLVNSAARFLSAAPFLCLIVDHFECPDMPLASSPATPAVRRRMIAQPRRSAAGGLRPAELLVDPVRPVTVLVGPGAGAAVLVHQALLH